MNRKRWRRRAHQRRALRLVETVRQQLASHLKFIVEKLS